MKNIRFDVTTTNSAFIFGFGWTDVRRIKSEKHLSIILGCIVIGIFWGKEDEKQS